ncbi:TetR/AcrR family transcriptional regulator [Sphingobium bisphenolivorans]|uniref:TetR/AcrR family transcriptional regulator n=1 Tax=Sphingobium bisphenolivorans TaxID=1335760 RepID=UPI00039C222A|nr:TetR/AcrR family transcriptional regulator [Sphingobium bisphenolivorans]
MAHNHVDHQIGPESNPKAGHQRRTAASARPPARGRPNKAAVVVIDAAILDAGWALFTSLGFDATSMEAVAERARVTKTTLYARHPDKIALLRAVTHHRLKKLSREAFDIDWIAGDSLEERLNHCARLMLRWGGNEEVRAALRLLDGCWGEAAVVARELSNAMREPVIALIAHAIAEDGGEQGEAPQRSEELAHVFLAILKVVASSAVDPFKPTEAEIPPLAKRAVALLLHGSRAW